MAARQGNLTSMDPDQLALALRSARARLRPHDVGLPAGSRRRVAGLRREEVAALAGISVDYLVRLEQGRGVRPSEQVLSALARALRLSRDERDHVFHLAGLHPPRPGRIDGVVRPSTLRLLERMTDLPAMVLDAKSDLLAHNAMALALVGDVTTLPPRERNVLRLRFLHASTRVAYPDEAARRAADEQVVADLRATAARYPDDPDLAALVADLRRGSALFAELWDGGAVRVQRAATKAFDHPEVGLLTLDCDVLLLPDSDQRMVVYSAEPGSSSARGLDLLRVVGLQELRSPR